MSDMTADQWAVKVYEAHEAHPVAGWIWHIGTAISEAEQRGFRAGVEAALMACKAHECHVETCAGCQCHITVEEDIRQLKPPEAK